MAEKATKAKAKTKYQVLVKRGEAWWEVGEEDAFGASSAIFQAATDPGTYRAVPVSNITEITVGYEEPPPPRLVAIDPAQLTVEQIQVGEDGYPLPAGDHPEADPPHSAAGGSIGAKDAA